MLTAVKVLILLWSINFAPPLLTLIFEDKGSTPLDNGRTLRDGNPLFGPHKTRRGSLGAVLTGVAAAPLLGFPWWMGIAAGVTSMAGDLLTSFLKRRFSLPSGSVVAGLDQVFEGLFPLLAINPYCGFGRWGLFALLVVFCVSTYAGSWLFKMILLREPSRDYRRTLRPSVRLRELRRCQVVSTPLDVFLNFEDAVYYNLFMKSVFRALGLYEKGMRNALDLRLRKLVLHFPDLPARFDGYTALFLTDLHLDGLEGLTERVGEVVGGLPVDLCIFGGDIRMETYGSYQKSVQLLSRLVSAVRAPDGIFAVLGNHDCLEMVEVLEPLGVSYLINDAQAVVKGSDELWLVGVDDPHHFKAHDLPAAFREVPEGAFSILAAHSPELYREAAPFGPRLYLCGHTHAGQIRIPRIGAVFTHSKSPRVYTDGIWRYRETLGYTSSGVGASGVPLRFNSRGEVVHITLKRSTDGQVSYSSSQVLPSPPASAPDDAAVDTSAEDISPSDSSAEGTSPPPTSALDTSNVDTSAPDIAGRDDGPDGSR